MATATDLQADREFDSLGTEPAEHYEVVDGRIVEEPPLGAYESRLASRLAKSINLFDPPGDFGEVVEEVLFVLVHSPRLRRRPDLAFVSQARWARDRPMSLENAWDVVPDLAVEIVSPSDLVVDVMAKLEEYFQAGVRLVWIIHPAYRKVYAYTSPSRVQILQIEDELNGETVLPGFKLPLSALFGLVRGEAPPTP